MIKRTKNMRLIKTDYWSMVEKLTTELGISRNAVIAVMEEGRKIGQEEGQDHQLWLDIMSLYPNVALDDVKTIAKYLSLSEEDVRYYLERRS
jgi:biotin operon repressor